MRPVTRQSHTSVSLVPKKKLIISVELDVPGTRNSAPDMYADEGLYGNSQATAFLNVIYRLLPGSSVLPTYYPEWQREPIVELVTCTATYATSDGEEFELDYDLTVEQIDALKKEALHITNHIRCAVRVQG